MLDGTDRLYAGGSGWVRHLPEMARGLRQMSTVDLSRWCGSSLVGAVPTRMERGLWSARAEWRYGRASVSAAGGLAAVAVSGACGCKSSRRRAARAGTRGRAARGSGPDSGVQARAEAWNPPSYGLTYCRLGPGPEYPTTELWSEGWSDEVYVQLRLWPPNHTTTGDRAGPPWLVGGWIELPCDVQDESCSGHLVGERLTEPMKTPYEAAAQVRLMADWVFEILTTAPPGALRKLDPRCGHPLAPRRTD